MTKSQTELAFQLNQKVQSLLPTACLRPFSLPALPIQLWLINEDYPRHRLPQEVALALMEQPLYWAFCWASGAVMAQLILENPHWVSGKRVVDFGSGSGVVAIAAAMAGARQVIACDLDEDAQWATLANARLNSVSVDMAGDFYEIAGPVDVLLAADVLYDRDNLPWLETFQQAATTVLIGDSRIKNFDFPGYRKLQEYPGCTLPDLDESAEFRRVSLYVAGEL